MSGVDRELALRGAVFQYLERSSDIAARRMQAQIDVTCKESLSTQDLHGVCRGTEAIKAVFGKTATATTVLVACGAASGSSTKSTPQPSPRIAPVKAAAAPAAATHEPVRRPRSASPAQLAVVVAKKKQVVSSSSDSDDAPVIKKSAAVVAPAPTATSSKPQQAEPAQSKKQPVGAPGGGKKVVEHFCRIDVDSVKFLDDRLRDNTCSADVASYRDNAKALSVRGNDFKKCKQKNKSKLYGAGVDMSVRSIKLANSDSD